MLLHAQSVGDGHVEHLTVTQTDGLIGNAAVEQLHSQMAGFESEGAVGSAGHGAALGVTNNGGTGFDAVALALEDAGQTLGVEAFTSIRLTSPDTFKITWLAP